MSSPTETPVPTTIRLRKVSRLLEVRFSDGACFELPFEYLRVFSPSAEVRGHGAGQAVLQVGKENVTVTSVTPIGQYAVRLAFDDGHDSGLYSWQYLYELGRNHDGNWSGYLERLAAAGHTRRPAGDAP